MTSIRDEYNARYQAALEPTARVLGDIIRDYLKDSPRIDRVTARAKGVASFALKAATTVGGEVKYIDPLEQIQDQIGARVVVFFKSDVDRVQAFLLRYFTPIEASDKVPVSDWEFNYFGRHFILVLPREAVGPHINERLLPKVFELQIKTLFQHAWSEAEHDLGYKPGIEPLTRDQNRRLAFTSAQAWGADRVFNELFVERQKTRP